MDNNQVLMIKDKLSFFGIIKESLKLIPRNPKFIILTFLTSFPYFCFLIFLEINFHKTFVDTLKSKLNPVYEHDQPIEGTDHVISYYVEPRPMDLLLEWIQQMFIPSLLPGFLYLGIVHLLHLLNTITTVHSASMIYAGEDTVNMKEMLFRPFRKVGLKGPLVTSVCALILASLTLVGIISLSTHFIFSIKNAFNIIFGLGIIALVVKYIEWSAIWNMGMVISILEEKHGDVALGVSAYISRGSRKRGFLLMLVFFVWWLALKLMWIYGMWTKSERMVIISVREVFLICVGNVIKWVVSTVYFYDCKKRFLEKKVDVEQGRSVETVKS